MLGKNRYCTKTITVDTARNVPPGRDHGGIVLMYDKERGCYYETTVESIAGAFIADLRVAEKKIDAKYKAIEQRLNGQYDALEKRLVDQQNKFISETAEANEKLIKLVEAYQK